MLSDLIYGVVLAIQQFRLLTHQLPPSTRVGELTAGIFQHCTLQAEAGNSILRKKKKRSWNGNGKHRLILVGLNRAISNT